MEDNKTSVDILWEEITSIQKILGEAKEGSSLNDYNKTIRKVLLLSCASFFEVEMIKMLKSYVRNVSNNDEKLVNFLEKQAINQNIIRFLSGENQIILMDTMVKKRKA